MHYKTHPQTSAFPCLLIQACQSSPKACLHTLPNPDRTYITEIHCILNRHFTSNTPGLSQTPVLSHAHTHTTAPKSTSPRQKPIGGTDAWARPRRRGSNEGAEMPRETAVRPAPAREEEEEKAGLPAGQPLRPGRRANTAGRPAGPAALRGPVRGRGRNPGPRAACRGDAFGPIALKRFWKATACLLRHQRPLRPLSPGKAPAAATPALTDCLQPCCDQVPFPLTQRVPISSPKARKTQAATKLTARTTRGAPPLAQLLLGHKAGRKESRKEPAAQQPFS